MTGSFGSIGRLDTAALAAAFARDGIVRIAGFLPPATADELHAHLRGRQDWLQLFNSGDKVFELDRPTRAKIEPAGADQLDEAIYAGAREGFQYRYESIRVPDDEQEREGSDDPVVAFARWMSSGDPREALRQICGAADVDFADAQATAYAPGDFLTGHDDAFDGKNRRAAYVYSLTPTWRIEWGGLLMMHGAGDEPARAYPPEMNLLTLFAVPAMHSVSEVTRAAAYRRYSITGWLRARP